MTMDTKDRAAVARQLGREPRGTWTVSRRCRCGMPQVIETCPFLGDGTPFPTMWWLSCKKLSAEVGGLEATGFMNGINARLEEDEEARSSLRDATDSYVARRDGLGFIPERAHPGGGPSRVKCLHAHVAHQLMTGDNWVGKEALEAISWEEPAEPCV